MTRTDESPKTIPALIAEAARRHSDLVAVVDATAGTTLTYAELHDAARAFGAALVEAGIAPGDRVSIWAPNSARWIVALFGLQLAGATLVPVNTRFKGTEAAEILERAHVRALVTVTDFLGTDFLAALREAAELPELAKVVIADGPVADDSTAWDEFVSSATPGALAEVDRRAAAVTSEDPADIIFTSGTTGRAKGVVQTQAGTLGVGCDWPVMTGLATGDRYLMVNPYFHMFGYKAGILASTSVGATMYPVPVLEVDAVLAAVANERITVLPGAPTLYQSILDHPDVGAHDLSSLRIAVTGAADIPVVLIERIYEELPFEIVMAGYGLTEGGTVSATAPDDAPEVVATTVGLPRPGFEVRLVEVHPDGEIGDDVTVHDGSTAGEILVRSASLMSHYLDDPDATAAAMTEDGWLRTGDLGMFDEAGRLRIVGRTKDMFIVGGFNAYPAEIENALLAHPEIAAVAVIGIPDERLGEVGMAFVVRAPDTTTSLPTTSVTTAADELPDAIIAWARERMANYKVPRRVELLDELPLNATGKVEKLVLAERARTSSPDV